MAKSTDHPSHEYLRYAVLRVLEGGADETSTDVPQIDGVTVGYGENKAMFNSWGSTSGGGKRFPRKKGVPASGCSTQTPTIRSPG